MSNFSKVSVAQDARTELHDKLSLTGAEVSINNLPAGACIPFVHAHKNNEEIYGILSGKGKAVIDGETVELAAGDWLRIARQVSASSLPQKIQGSAISVSRLRKIHWEITLRLMQ